jgi:hypothetical protein
MPCAADWDAFKFVLHLVGDLHQPLRAADDHDAGGKPEARPRVDIPTRKSPHF